MKTLIFCVLALLSSLVYSQTCPTSPNSVGAGALLSYTPEAGPTGAAFTVIDAPPEVFGVIIYSPVSTPPMPWGQGTLCIQPFVYGAGRMLISQVDYDGTIVVQDVPPELEGTFAQFWYRDFAEGVNTFNLTNSVEVL